VFKNVTVRQLTIILTLALGVINLASLFTLYAISTKAQVSIAYWLIIVVVSTLLIYAMVRYSVEYFVFRRIRLIYKMIDAGKRRKSYRVGGLFDDKSIAAVNDEVIEWAQKRETEIEYLTQIEDYRRLFLGNISHELKTPIFSLQGYVHTLIEGGLYDEAINMKYLKKASKNIERLEKIVDDLEEINQLQSGGITLKLESFSIKELMYDIFDDLAFMAKDERTSMMINKDSKDFKVLADRDRITQVLLNLVANAIKYGKEEGSVIISFYDVADKVLIEVEDDGQGIEEKHLKHLFDRFYRVDEGRSRKHGGSGLGLSIVKHIIEAHDQTTSVRSTVGEGTTVGFTLNKSK